MKASLIYDKGTIIIRGIAHIPYSFYDPRAGCLRAAGLYYSEILKFLHESQIQIEDRVMNLIPTPDLRQSVTANAENIGETSRTSLRDYQQSAIDRWIAAGMRGFIVMPTGSGKTLVGIKAIETVNLPSLVVVPTIDLIDQWTDSLGKYFTGVKIGNIGGGSDTVEAITVCTYDSAYIRAGELGNKFALVIFDEVHHLAAPAYRTIAEQMVCPYRLGLTATIEREDNLHKDIPRYIGGMVYQANPDGLVAENYLAPYEIQRRKVKLSPEEKLNYQKNTAQYQKCIAQLGLKFHYGDILRRLIMMSYKNPTAREALLCRNRAMDIALNSSSKIEELREILAYYKNIKTIIFTQHNSLVLRISDTFLIPLITHKTLREERIDVLEGFRTGRYSAIVTSKVLDEGVDVPDAQLGIILSGTGSGREFIQRLGRLLRPSKSNQKKALLIEITSMQTSETSTSNKRRRAFEKSKFGLGSDKDSEGSINHDFQTSKSYYNEKSRR